MAPVRLGALWLLGCRKTRSGRCCCWRPDLTIPTLSICPRTSRTATTRRWPPWTALPTTGPSSANPPQTVPTTCTLRRGKVVGGTSAINGQVFLRGLPEDYDSWAAEGNDEWGYVKLLPILPPHGSRPGHSRRLPWQRRPDEGAAAQGRGLGTADVRLSRRLCVRRLSRRTRHEQPRLHRRRSAAHEQRGRRSPQHRLVLHQPGAPPAEPDHPSQCAHHPRPLRRQPGRWRPSGKAAARPSRWRGI